MKQPELWLVLLCFLSAKLVGDDFVNRQGSPDPIDYRTVSFMCTPEIQCRIDSSVVVVPDTISLKALRSNIVDGVCHLKELADGCDAGGGDFALVSAKQYPIDGITAFASSIPNRVWVRKDWIEDPTLLSIAYAGAVQGGAIDVSHAFQRALSSAKGRAIVEVPPGRWLLSSSVSIPSHSRLQGRRGTKILGNNGSIPLFLHGLDVDNTSITIDGLEIRGTVDGSVQSAIIIANCDSVTIKNCYIHCFPQTGIRLSNAPYSLIEHNLVDSCGLSIVDATNQAGIIIQNSSNSEVRGNTVTHTGVGQRQQGYGISLLGSHFVKVRNNLCEWNYMFGIIASGGTYEGLEVIGNICTFNGHTPTGGGAGGGINFHGLRNSLIAGNIVNDNLNSGIEINGSGGRFGTIRVTSNACRRNRNYGIYIFQFRNAIVSQNICDSNKANIGLSGASDCALVDNYCGHALDSTGRALTSIVVSGCSSDILIDRNKIVANTETFKTNMQGIDIDTCSTIILGKNEIDSFVKKDTVQRLK